MEDSNGTVIRTGSKIRVTIEGYALDMRNCTSLRFTYSPDTQYADHYLRVNGAQITVINEYEDGVYQTALGALYYCHDNLFRHAASGVSFTPEEMRKYHPVRLVPEK
jgi:hypothetical protein